MGTDKATQPPPRICGRPWKSKRRHPRAIRSRPPGNFTSPDGGGQISSGWKEHVEQAIEERFQEDHQPGEEAFAGRWNRVWRKCECESGASSATGSTSYPGASGEVRPERRCTPTPENSAAFASALLYWR